MFVFRIKRFIFWSVTEAVNAFPEDEACGWYFPCRSLMRSFYVWNFALASAAVCLLHFLVYFDRFEDVYQRGKWKKVSGKSQGEFMRILSFEHHILLRWTRDTFLGFHLETTSIIHFFVLTASVCCLPKVSAHTSRHKRNYIFYFPLFCLFINVMFSPA